MEEKKVSQYLTESVLVRLERIRTRLEISLIVALVGLGVTNIVWLLVYNL